MKSLIKWLLGLYVAIGIVTLVLQIYWRFPECSGAMGCGLSYAKGVVWAVIWPAYWWIQRGMLL